MQQNILQQNQQKEDIKKVVKEIATQEITEQLKSGLFTSRKLTDTPSDALQVVNRKYVTLNGTVASRPVSSVATIGQSYLATDTSIPMTYTAGGWVNGVGSIVALNN